MLAKRTFHLSTIDRELIAQRLHLAAHAREHRSLRILLTDGRFAACAAASLDAAE